MQNHSVIEVEANSNRTNDVPTIEYNFVKVPDIINVSSDDKIDVLVVCSQVGPCVNQTTRAGRETKKREVQVAPAPIDISKVPNFIEPIVDKGIKSIILIIADGITDAIVAIFNEGGWPDTPDTPDAPVEPDTPE